ncbi:MAG: ABC transporter permease [Myxococcales bacterium]|nr:ABC transporter permease [Myxococcales bacterium]
MRWRQLITRDLVRHKRQWLGVCIAVASSVGVTAFMGALTAGVYRYAIKPMVPRLPLEYLRVEPRTLSIGGITFDAGRLSGGYGLDESTLGEIQELKGVAKVFPVVGAKVPLRAEGGEGFLGRRLRTDIFATGVPPELIEDDIADGQEFKDNPEGPVPVVIARRLLELYNTTVAPVVEKPRLSERMATGFMFVIQIGRSYATASHRTGKVRKVQARIVGFSDRASMVGLTIPEATMRRWNREYGSASPVSAAWVQLEDPAYAGAVTKRIEQWGLRLDETPKLMAAGIAIAGLLLVLCWVLLLMLSAWAIAQVYFLMLAERRTEFAVIRALGARKWDLCRWLLIESVVVGTVGTLIGLVVGLGAAIGLSEWLRSFVAVLSFKPVSLVDVPLVLLGLTLFLGIGASVCGALVPAVLTSRIEPGSALRN